MKLPAHNRNKLLNQTFGDIKVIEYLGQMPPNSRITYWKCECLKGHTINIIGTRLKNGMINRCRQCVLNDQKYISKVKQKFRSYIFGAKNRNLQFDLTFEQVQELIESPCVFCEKKAESSLNGIDRMNNEYGYIFGNCYSCCKTCNRMKSDMTYEKFKEHIFNISSCLKKNFL